RMPIVPRSLSIRHRLTLITVGVSTLAVLLACTVWIAVDWSSFCDAMVRDLRSTASMTGANCAAAIRFTDHNSAEETLASLQAMPNVRAAAVWDARGALFARYLRAGEPADAALAVQRTGEVERGSDALYVQVPIRENGEALGTLGIESDLDALRARARSFILI